MQNYFVVICGEASLNYHHPPQKCYRLNSGIFAFRIVQAYIILRKIFMHAHCRVNTYPFIRDEKYFVEGKTTSERREQYLQCEEDKATTSIFGSPHESRYEKGRGCRRQRQCAQPLHFK